MHWVMGAVGLGMTLLVLAALAFVAFALAKKFRGRCARGDHAGPHHGPGHRPHHDKHGHTEPDGPQGPPVPKKALRILDERLAKSEIEIDDYKARRDALTGNHFPPFHQPPAPQAPPVGVQDPPPAAPEHLPPTTADDLTGPGKPDKDRPGHHDDPPPAPAGPDNI